MSYYVSRGLHSGVEARVAVGGRAGGGAVHAYAADEGALAGGEAGVGEEVRGGWVDGGVVGGGGGAVTEGGGYGGGVDPAGCGEGAEG